MLGNKPFVRYLWLVLVAAGMALLACPNGGGNNDAGMADSGSNVDAGNSDDAGCRRLHDICTAEYACCPGQGLSCEGVLCCLSLDQTCAHDGECCSKNCAGGKCAVRTQCQDAGTPCSIDDQCCPGLSCYQSECQNCAGFGKPCGTGVTCCPGLGCDSQGTCG